jgi:hypothetical protein
MPTLLYFHHAHALMRLRVCLVSNFTNFFLSFGPLFYRMELNTMQNFWQKRIHSPFCILASRGKKKKPKSSHPSHEKFSILDGTKHIHKNFGILHFIISLAFCIFYFMGN